MELNRKEDNRDSKFKERVQKFINGIAKRNNIDLNPEVEETPIIISVDGYIEGEDKFQVIGETPVTVLTSLPISIASKSDVKINDVAAYAIGTDDTVENSYKFTITPAETIYVESVEITTNDGKVLQISFV